MKFIKPYNHLARQDGYGRKEVGVTHPELPSNITINDAKDIDLTSESGVGVSISGSTDSIILTGRSVKFITKPNGLYWNNKQFNQAAVQYHQPLLVEKDSLNVVSGTGEF